MARRANADEQSLDERAHRRAAADLHAPTRLALLTGLAPHQVTDDDVAAARSLLDTDAALVGALAWAAFTAARRIGTWIGAAAEGQVSRQNPTG